MSATGSFTLNLSVTKRVRGELGFWAKVNSDVKTTAEEWQIQFTLMGLFSFVINGENSLCIICFENLSPLLTREAKFSAVQLGCSNFPFCVICSVAHTYWCACSIPYQIAIFNVWTPSQINAGLKQNQKLKTSRKASAFADARFGVAGSETSMKIGAARNEKQHLLHTWILIILNSRAFNLSLLDEEKHLCFQVGQRTALFVCIVAFTEIFREDPASEQWRIVCVWGLQERFLPEATRFSCKRSEWLIHDARPEKHFCSDLQNKHDDNQSEARCFAAAMGTRGISGLMSANLRFVIFAAVKQLSETRRCNSASDHVLTIMSSIWRDSDGSQHSALSLFFSLCFILCFNATSCLLKRRAFLWWLRSSWNSVNVCQMFSLASGVVCSISALSLPTHSYSFRLNLRRCR